MERKRVDDFRSIKENLFKVLTGKSQPEGRDYGEDDDDGGGSLGIDASAARALIAAVFARAGKGKDEVVQIVAREIGMAVAAMLKEPLAQLAKHQKLQISFEFVPKDGAAGKPDEPEPKRPAAAAPGAPHPPKHTKSGTNTKHSSPRRKADKDG